MQKVSLSNKVFTDNPLLDEIVYNARQLATGTVLKDTDKANNSETVESIHNGDLLIAITNGMASFEDFIYDYNILHMYYGDDPRISDFEQNNTLIPKSDREDLKNLAIKLFKNNFVEYNNYYRELHGDPPIDKDLEDYEGLWIDVNYIDESVPTDLSHIYPYYIEETDKQGNVISDYRLIHELFISDIHFLYDNGTIDNIMNAEDTVLNVWQLPSMDYIRYLLHMGDKSIDYYEARTADRFELLYCPECDSEEVKKRYKDLIEANRLYTLYTIYSDAYKYRSDYYDNFMMIMIILQTIIDLIMEVPDYVVRKDIFDTRTCKYIFESNGVKYFKDIPLRYQISLVKNLNRLIKYKSTDQCIIDIVSLFGFNNNIKAFRYYILRDRLVTDPSPATLSTLHLEDTDSYVINDFDMPDPEGHIVVADEKVASYEDVNKLKVNIDTYEDIKYYNYKKIITDTTGETYIVPDNDKNYDLKFVKVPLLGKYDDYIRDGKNIYTYDEITDSDAYWIGDKNYQKVKSEIKDLDFNVLRSKYYTVEAVVDLTKRNFVIVYFMNILLYNKIDSSALKISLPNVSTTSKSTLVNAILALYALGYFYYGVEDVIMDTRSKTASILGFNTEVDLPTIAQYIKDNFNYARMDDDNTLESLGVAGFNMPSDDNLILTFDQLQEIYLTNKDIYDHVRSVMMDPPNKEVYNAYRYLYKSLFITNRNMEYFLVGDSVDIVNEYKENGYTTHFFYIPKREDYTREEDYERDYALFLEKLNTTTLYFEESEFFEDDHSFDLYTFDGTDIVNLGIKVTMARTYTEYLRYNDINLYTYLQNIINMPSGDRQEACVNGIQTIIGYMKDYIDQDGDDAIYLDEVFSGLPSISLEFVKKYVMEVIDFFKAFEIFTHSSSAIFVFDDKFEQYVQLIDETIFHLLFEKSTFDKIEDAIDKSVINLNPKDKMKLLDKIWLDIDTWVQKNYTEYYNSDKYSELSNVIRDSMERLSTLEFSSDTFVPREIPEIEQIAVDAMMKVLVDINFNTDIGIVDGIAKMNHHKEFDDYYNEWLSDLISVIISNKTIEDGIVDGQIYYCNRCGKKITPTTDLCPYCGSPVLDPIIKNIYKTNIVDYLFHNTTTDYLQRLDLRDTFLTFGNTLYKELSPISDDIHTIITQEFPAHEFNV